MIDAPARKITILLVEDDDSDAEKFDSMLVAAAPGDFEVARATTFADATTYLKSVTPDCAVIDLKLTDVEGVEIIESLAALSCAVALIVLTRQGDDALGVPAVVAGAIDYLPKTAHPRSERAGHS